MPEDEASDSKDRSVAPVFATATTYAIVAVTGAFGRADLTLIALIIGGAFVVFTTLGWIEIPTRERPSEKDESPRPDFDAISTEHATANSVLEEARRRYDEEWTVHRHRSTELGVWLVVASVAQAVALYSLKASIWSNILSVAALTLLVTAGLNLRWFFWGQGLDILGDPCAWIRSWSSEPKGWEVRLAWKYAQAASTNKAANNKARSSYLRSKRLLFASVCASLFSYIAHSLTSS